MSSFLVIYATGEGQTAKVADRLGTVLNERGHDTTVLNVNEIPAPFDLDEFDAVLVGASIHVGKHQAAIGEFVRNNLEAVTDRPTAFFQLSLSSAVTSEARQAEAARYVEEFLEETGWHPDRIGCFGGALRYSKYGFLKRLMMKQIAKDATGDTDPSRDYEYTDWLEVEAFANDFAAFVEGRFGARSPDAGEETTVD